jgi:hypothetical protein
MRKMFSILVLLLLPLLGLGAGLWLVPEAKPLWEKQTTQTFHPVGLVNDDKTFLVLETFSEWEHNLLGFDATTGAEQLRQELKLEPLQIFSSSFNQTVLSQDGHYIVFCAQSANGQYVFVLYDWKQQHIAERFQLPEHIGYFNRVSYEQGCLLVSTNTGVYRWTRERPASPVCVVQMNPNILNQVVVKLNNEIMVSYESHIEQDSTVYNLIICDLARKGQAKYKLPVVLQVMDYQDGIIACILPDIVAGNPNGLRVSKYRINENGGVDQLETNPLLDIHSLGSTSHDAVFTYMAISLWKRYLIERFGEWSDWLPFLRTTTYTLEVYDRRTMKPLHRVALPIDEKRIPAFSHQFELNRRQSTLLYSEWQTIQCWQLNTFSRYFPLLGLLAGTLCSLALIIRRLRWRKPLPIHPRPVS